MPRTWTLRLARLVGTATAGALVALAVGQLSQMMGGTCTVLCDPQVAVPLGGLTGVFAFWNVGREG